MKATCKSFVYFAFHFGRAYPSCYHTCCFCPLTYWWFICLQFSVGHFDSRCCCQCICLLSYSPTELSGASSTFIWLLTFLMFNSASLCRLIPRSSMTTSMSACMKSLMPIFSKVCRISILAWLSVTCVIFSFSFVAPKHAVQWAIK